MSYKTLSKEEAKQRDLYLRLRMQYMPASLKTIYSDMDGNSTLVATELYVDDHLFFGIEYTTDGEVASTYTTDKNGKRVQHKRNLTNTKSKFDKIIAERMESLTKESPKETEATKKPTVRKLTPKSVTKFTPKQTLEKNKQRA